MPRRTHVAALFAILAAAIILFQEGQQLTAPDKPAYQHQAIRQSNAIGRGKPARDLYSEITVW